MLSKVGTYAAAKENPIKVRATILNHTLLKEKLSNKIH